MVVPQDVCIWRSAAEIELRCLVVNRWGGHVLANRPSNAGPATSASVVVGRQFAISRPALVGLKPIKSAAATAAVDRDSDGSRGCATALVPLFDRGVVCPWTQSQVGAKAGARHGVGLLIRGSI